MKLNNFKISLALTVLLSVLLFAVSGFGDVTGDGSADNPWIIESQADFNKLVGKQLSAVDLVGDSEPDIENGDTIVLDTGEVTEFDQTAPIIIDLKNITFDGNENWIVQQDGYGVYGEVDIGSNGSGAITQVNTASLVIEEAGAHIRNLTFKGCKDITTHPNNAILVNVGDYCSCEDINRLEFDNVETEPCTDCAYDYGIRFVGDVDEWGRRNTSYSEVDFDDVRVGATAIDGIKFENSVANLSDINFNKLYIGGSGACGYCSDTYYGPPVPPNPPETPNGVSSNGEQYQGHGIWFDNYGKLEDVTLDNSQGVDGQYVLAETGSYGIEDNTDGIRISGETVTKVDNFRIDHFDIKGNCDNGINITGDCTPGGDCTFESEEKSSISFIDLIIKNTKISGNGDELDKGNDWVPEDLGADEGLIDGGFGILVGTMCPEAEGLDICNSTAEIADVLLDNVKVFNNTNGGAGLFVSSVSGDESDPALKVVDSQFNQDLGEGGTNPNQQGFGLAVAAYEGIRGVEISNSTFNDHDGGLTGVSLPELPDQNFGDGIALLATYVDGARDSVESVTIENTNANDNITELPDENDGNGLRIEGRTVKNVNILKEDTFNDNGKDGVNVHGETGVDGLTMEGSGDDTYPILANGNGNDGLFVGSGNDDRENDGYIKGLHVSNVQFGEDGHENLGNGVELLTDESGSDIGSLESDGAVVFDHIYVTYNLAHGMRVKSAGSFKNPSGKIFVNNSEFSYNWEDGLYLVAADNVENPRIANSTFVGNNVHTYGIYISTDSGGEIKGSSNTVEILGNVVANNTKGIVIGGKKEDDGRAGLIEDFAIQENTTENPDGDENGNSVLNIALIADKLLSIDIRSNRLIGPYNEEDAENGDEVAALWLLAKNSSSNIMVKENLFDSEAAGECIGDGTAIIIDAKNTTVKRNEIRKFATAIKLMQENSGSSRANDASNHINENNIIGNCITVDASALDYGNGEMVDARNNFWGEGYTTPESLAINMLAGLDVDDPLDQIKVSGIRSKPFDIVVDDIEIGGLSITPEEPGVDEPIELEYTLTNTTGSDITLASVRLTVTDGDDDTIVDNQEIESNITVNANDSETLTHEFTTGAQGDHEVTITANGYTGSFTFEVGEVEPAEKTPYWGGDGDRSKCGILPAPVDGTETPFLELANESGNSVHSYVTVNVVKVFDLSGRKVAEIEDINNMSALEDLNNGLYLYTVDYEAQGESEQSPVMKFLVKK